MMDVSGVRSSWLMVAMKSLLSSSRWVRSRFLRASSSLNWMLRSTSATWSQSARRVATAASGTASSSRWSRQITPSVSCLAWSGATRKPRKPSFSIALSSCLTLGSVTAS